MSGKPRVPVGLDYLRLKPKRINWIVIAGSDVSYVQSYDLVFDDYDYRIRQLVF